MCRMDDTTCVLASLDKRGAILAAPRIGNVLLCYSAILESKRKKRKRRNAGSSKHELLMHRVVVGQCKSKLCPERLKTCHVTPGLSGGSSRSKK